MDIPLNVWVYRQLQLGHAGEGVEITKDNAKLTATILLQLGHAGEGVEMCLVKPCWSPVLLLQLGHAGEGVEIRDN